MDPPRFSWSIRPSTPHNELFFFWISIDRGEIFNNKRTSGFSFHHHTWTYLYCDLKLDCNLTCIDRQVLFQHRCRRNRQPILMASPFVAVRHIFYSLPSNLAVRLKMEFLSPVVNQRTSSIKTSHAASWNVCGVCCQRQRTVKSRWRSRGSLSRR